MTLQEAMEISDRLLPGEPGSDELANWRAAMPRPEPPKRERRLDTAPEIDWASVIRGELPTPSGMSSTKRTSSYPPRSRSRWPLSMRGRLV